MAGIPARKKADAADEAEVTLRLLNIAGDLDLVVTKATAIGLAPTLGLEAAALRDAVFDILDSNRDTWALIHRIRNIRKTGD